MGNQKTQLLQKENAEPLKSGNKTADSKKPGKRASEKPMNMPGKGFGSLSDIPLTPENILFLQRTIGNRATTKLVQAKLKIGQPGDEYEREADQVAEQVIRMPETSPAQETAVSNQANVGQIQRFNLKHEEELQRQPMEEEEKRKRQEEEGALQMKPAGSLGMVQRQSMAEEEKRKRMEEEGAVSAKENPGQTPAISPKVESQIEAMRGSGEQLPESVRAHFEPRFGQDFSEVRVHKDAPAAESAQAIDARAYTTGRDLVFGAGEYAPETTEGKRLLAHELTHVVQQGASEALDSGTVLFKRTSKTSRNGFIQRAPTTPKPRDPTVDEIAQEIGPALGGPYADYAAFAATMVPGSFLGHAIARGVRPELLAKLQTAKTKIDAEFAKSGTPIPPGYGITSVGGFRSKAGPHGWGLAIDIDVTGNPFVMHEHNEATLDAQLSPVYHRIAEFMLNTPINGEQSIIPKIITQGKSMTGTAGQSRADRLGEYYDRLALESQAMQDYFALMKNPATDAIAKCLAGSWQQKHPASTPPAPDDVRRHMWEDYATLGGQIPKGGPPGVAGFQGPKAIGAKADRPFAPNSGSPQDPASGFLTIPREVVLGLGQMLTRWGAIDFGGESGDVQHFDDMGNLGTAIAAAKNQANAKIAAARTSP